jgi:transglutaminase-like putative cysteine protease
MKFKPAFSILASLLSTSAIVAPFVSCVQAPTAARAQQRTSNRWWSAAVDAALLRAGGNRAELVKALRSAPAAQRDGIQFLIENMPDQDLKTLSANYLLENTAIAYLAMERAPWQNEISKSLFLNDVLPYACLNERRDESRRFLKDRAEAIVAGCKSPGEAAQKLNQQLFSQLKAKYSTERKKPDQSPIETAESGKATCSGLSILLVGACRAVGIPARVAGTPMWTNMRGNHTWVEVWDNGWHFVGAAEPDPNGLDRGWFTGDASRAKRDVPEHAIYASSFRKSAVSFPLVWAPEIKWVYAENVTDRYTPMVAAADSGKSRIDVKVLTADGHRAAVPVTLLASGETPRSGTSKGETSDMNDFLGFDVFRVCPPRKYTVQATLNGHVITANIMAGAEARQLVTLQEPPAAERGLSSLLADRFGPDAAKRAAAAKRLATMHNADADTRKLIWNAYTASPVHEPLRQEFGDKKVATADRTSPYLWRYVGTRPADGWALVIAMHGGGGAPKQVNDGEWNYMYTTYYREHPEAGGYAYLALRAPNDTWNGFYDDSISPLVERLIKQFVLFAGVNPAKVFIMGASHGGYGAYVLGPKIPYRFAAVHAAAGAGTDGETMGENLRNVRFTTMVGERDTAYGRIERGRAFQQKVADWKKQYGGYDAEFFFPTNVGHLVPDHDWLAGMLKYRRNAAPDRIVWRQSDNVLHRNYWVEALAPSAGGSVDARVAAGPEGSTITISSEKQKGIALWLDPSLVDFKKPVTVVYNGKKSQVRLKPDLETYCAGLEQMADPALTAPCRVVITEP